MLPVTLQFLIAMIASSINDRAKRKLDYALEEVRVLKDTLQAATGSMRIPFSPDQRRRLALAGKELSPCEPQKLCADCVALGILSLLAGMAVDDGDSRGQWRLSRNPCSPHASWRERRRLGHGHGFGQFSGRALGVANSRPIQGRTSSDLQTATLYSWCSPPRMGTARTLLAGVGRIGGNQCAPNGACMCSPR
jgi:hypothetical protein